jgi:hypothetical protein
MKVEELVPLTNGLSVMAGPNTFVCDRARVREIPDDGIDLKFLIAGTDIVPRLRFQRDRFARATADEITRMVRRVVRRSLSYS